MTIREELRKLGPDAVRRAMVAFEHRSAGQGSFQACDHAWGCCCFLTHTNLHDGDLGLILMMSLGVGQSSVERAFEGDRLEREDLRQECIAFLAENGSAVGRVRVDAETQPKEPQS